MLTKPWRNCWSKMRPLRWLWGWPSRVSFLWMTVSFHQQKILAMHFPCAALSVLQDNKNQKRSLWYLTDFRILTAVTSQRLLYRLRRKSKLLKKKQNVLAGVKSMKSVSPPLWSWSCSDFAHAAFFIPWALPFTVTHKEKCVNQCLQDHSQLFIKRKFW